MNPILHKYEQRVDTIQSLICVGLDPVLTQIPERFHSAELPFFEFNKWIIDLTAEYTAAYKPNVAFYEARGLQGFAELKQTIDYLRSTYPEIVTVCDAKRADLANTNKGYVTAVFDELGFDSVTLHPYLGQEALAPFLDRHDKACIILCRTSNPGAAEFQDLLTNGIPLWQTVADRVANRWDVDGNCMLVVGATYPDEMRKIRSVAPRTTFLVPGVGAQGGDINAVISAGLSAEGRGLMISSSREIIFSDDPAAAARNLRDAINAAKEAIHAAN
jgi:orotidine-5'-phosphate decarboxylase